MHDKNENEGMWVPSSRELGIPEFSTECLEKDIMDLICRKYTKGSHALTLCEIVGVLECIKLRLFAQNTAEDSDDEDNDDDGNIRLY